MLRAYNPKLSLPKVNLYNGHTEHSQPTYQIPEERYVSYKQFRETPSMFLEKLKLTKDLQMIAEKSKLRKKNGYRYPFTSHKKNTLRQKQKSLSLDRRENESYLNSYSLKLEPEAPPSYKSPILKKKTVSRFKQYFQKTQSNKIKTQISEIILKQDSFRAMFQKKHSFDEERLIGKNIFDQIKIGLKKNDRYNEGYEKGNEKALKKTKQELQNFRRRTKMLNTFILDPWAPDSKTEGVEQILKL